MRGPMHACVQSQCHATLVEHQDELAARQFDPVELEATHLVRLAYAALRLHLPVGLVHACASCSVACLLNCGGWLSVLAGLVDGESMDGRELWLLWWVNMSSSMTGAVLFDRWVGKAVLGQEFRMWDQLTEAAGAGTRDFTDTGRSVLHTVMRFWRRFAMCCTPTTRLDFQKFQTQPQSILAAADVDDAGMQL